MTSPAITVLLPVHNGGAFLEEAVSSIIAQTFVDFELLIVDDASTDYAIDNLSCLDDSRLRVERIAHKGGIVAALNHGLKCARGPLIARMDADDIAEPNRLELQYAFLKSHASIGLVGSDFIPFGSGANSSWINYTEPEDIRIALLFENPICHPTVMYRQDVLYADGYPVNYPYAEEYALWLRLAGKTKLANIPSRLMRYRTHAAQVSQQKSREQCCSIDRLHLEQLAALSLYPSPAELKLHHALGSAFYPAPGLRSLLLQWIDKLYRANEIARIYPIELFQSQIQQRLFSTLERTQKKLKHMSPHRRFQWQALTFLHSFK